MGGMGLITLFSQLSSVIPSSLFIYFFPLTPFSSVLSWNSVQVSFTKRLPGGLWGCISSSSCEGFNGLAET